MKAAFITTVGGPSVIQYADMDVPELLPNQVLIRTAAVAVNPIDTYIRSGSVKANLPSRYIVGCDVAGTVESTGSDVTQFSTGDRVWASNQGLAGRQGTFAEYCAIDEEWLYRSPENVADETLAANALTGITAHLGLHLHGQLCRDDVVFVNGGTGGVGSAVVQIAKAFVATVITTVGSQPKADLARELGADHVINYRESSVQHALKQCLATSGPVNVWFESLRNPDPEFTFPLLAKRGRYVLMAGRDARPTFPVGPFYVNDLRAIGFAMFNASSAEQRVAAEELNQLMACGKMQAVIGARFLLKDAAAAHQLQEDNTIGQQGTLSGKIVVTT